MQHNSKKYIFYVRNKEDALYTSLFAKYGK